MYPHGVREYKEDEFLMISGLQHFKFCRRQWALIHLENQWSENYLTADGRIMHERAHDAAFHESRGDTLIYRGMNVFSPSLGISGQCDVVEFHRNPGGVELNGHDGKWLPYPIEYKRGGGKSVGADALQLCAQALCLEEMLCVSIPFGALYYGEKRRREQIELDETLRNELRECLDEMHSLASRGHTPRVRTSKSCSACSMKEICMPELMKESRVSDYIKSSLEELDG